MFISSIILQGELGDQLFQIFTLYSYALQHNYRIYLSKIKEDNTKYTYWDTIFKYFKPYLVDVHLLQHTRFYHYIEQVYNYRTLPTVKNNIMLTGYFQSYKYFDKYKEDIYQRLKIKTLQEEVINMHMVPYIDSKKVSIHFKIGNDKDSQNILGYNYYEKCIEMITNKIDDILFIYFYEEEDYEQVQMIINQLKDEFTNTFIPINTCINDWEQLLCISCCNHNIISNCNFSWWGAYLNMDNYKKVYYPSKWFSPTLSYNTCTLFPNTWIKVNC
ncbi:MAG: hypothetical protein CMG46_02280 [Candidatus Marinimicrobia bacterium]|nr:hypothetical protein [Candidatus Neomarinimicrobiota bacterium]|tara:strand:+ start:67 stop:885 length:819 start_codon:yes stop_codon:yes gene_type:complete